MLQTDITGIVPDCFSVEFRYTMTELRAWVYVWKCQVKAAVHLRNLAAVTMM